MKNDKLWCADLGDGTYRNPVLFADYSDPDVICVDGVYYMTASSFNYVPGLPILVSRDLVNWQLVNYALPRIPEDAYVLPRPSAGVWAPAIRYHDGVFYIVYGMPDEGIFSVRTRDPLGAWEAPVCILQGKGLIDPCPFWDEDGQTYIVHGYARSRIGFKSFLGIFPVDAALTAAQGEDHLLYNGLQTNPTIEGPKVHRRGDYVYIFAPAGGVEQGWQTVLRSRDIHGPFEERVVLRQGTSLINGPHQGAWVETPQGEHWFIHFQSIGAYGRVVHLQPMTWSDNDWPVIGENNGNEDWGTPCLTHAKPRTSERCAILSLQASDDFSGEALALQWQFFGNMPEDAYALEQHGLRLNALPIPCGKEPLLWHCPQALTQKLVCPAFEITVSMAFEHLQSMEQAGMALMGGQYVYLAVRKDAAGQAMLALVRSSGNDPERIEQTEVELPLSVAEHVLTLRMTLTRQNDQPHAVFAYSLDGMLFTDVGTPFLPTRHTWVGAKPTLFAMATAQHDACGYALFRRFEVKQLPVDEQA